VRGVDELVERSGADQVRDVIDLERLRCELGAVPIGEAGRLVNVNLDLHNGHVPLPG
jgi:hypothetical protein